MWWRGLGSAVGGAASLNHLRQMVGQGAPDLQRRLIGALDTALHDPHLRLPADGGVLIPQMIVAADPSLADVMARMQDPAHRAPPMQDAFRRVVGPILRGMLADSGLSAVLQPA